MVPSKSSLDHLELVPQYHLEVLGLLSQTKSELTHPQDLDQLELLLPPPQPPPPEKLFNKLSMKLNAQLEPLLDFPIN